MVAKIPRHRAIWNAHDLDLFDEVHFDRVHAEPASNRRTVRRDVVLTMIRKRLAQSPGKLKLRTPTL
jgi:hypothetical protein